MYSLNWSMSHPVYLLSVHRYDKMVGLEDFRTKLSLSLESKAYC